MKEGTIVFKTRILVIIVVCSLFVNACCGIYILPRLFSHLNSSSSSENSKYGARLSTFELTSNKTDIVFLGDSITAYIDWNEFFPDKSLLNRGIEGDNVGGTA